MFQLKKWLIVVIIFFATNAVAQNRAIVWAADGLSYYKIAADGIVLVDPKTEKENGHSKRKERKISRKISKTLN